MSRTSLREVSESTRSERGRFVDLRIDLVAQDELGRLHDDGERILSVGGNWDRALKRYVGEATTARTLGLHGGQLEPARWMARWFDAKVKREILREKGRPIFSTLFVGGRRAGKTDLGAKSALCYAVARPGSFVWMISESIPKTEELEENVTNWMPRDWYDALGAPWYTFTLVNGSVIWLRSAHNPKALKRGRCDFALLNEAQNMVERAFTVARASTADSGGLTVLAANPPDDDPKGEWVERFYDGAIAGKRGARAFFFDAKKNPHVNRESLEGMKDELDEREYAIEILGEFRPRKDVVFHAWSPKENVLPVPKMGDITDRFLAARFGREDVRDTIIGTDFQLYPHMVAVVMRAFADPEAPGGEPLLWFTDEVLVDAGRDENDLIDAMLSKGYAPKRCIVIGDASAAWQRGQRKREKLAPGDIHRASFDIFRARGWVIYPPDQDMEANPHIIERIKVGNARMKTADGKRHLFSDPQNELLNRALRSWAKNQYGEPNRRSDFAHLCDAATYPLWRFYPRKMMPGKFEYEGTERDGTAKTLDDGVRRHNRRTDAW